MFVTRAGSTRKSVIPFGELSVTLVLRVAGFRAIKLDIVTDSSCCTRLGAMDYLFVEFVEVIWSKLNDIAIDNGSKEGKGNGND